MQIAHIKISNILGIEDMEFSAGRFNSIEGKNGQGKTSVLEAIKTVVEGVSEATLIRNGAERGEVVFLMDDGTEIKHVVGNRAQTTITNRDGTKQASPRTAIKALTDALSVNPVEFLRARPKDRVSILLECLPLKADPVRLEEIAGAAAKVADPNHHALTQIDAIHKSVFDDRTGTNRAIREKQATINQLEQTLPDAADMPIDNIEELEQKAVELDAKRDAENLRIDTKLAELRTAHQAKIDEHQAKVDDLQKQIEVERQHIVTERANFAETERRAEAQRQIGLKQHTDAKTPIANQIAVIRSNRDAATRAKVTRENIEAMGVDLKDLEADAERMSMALIALEAYKSELLATLPIAGLEVKAGEIFRHGVVYDRLNRAQQVDIAFQIAILRAGGMNIICVDELESLDSESYEAFRESALKSGAQLFVTRVADTKLQINTF